MVCDLIRDSTVGQIVHYLSSGRLLRYPDERPDYVVPQRYLPPPPSGKQLDPSTSDPSTLCEGCTKATKEISHNSYPPDAEVRRESTIATLVPDLEQPVVTSNSIPAPYLADWDGDSDPGNPLNWSTGKRAFVAFNISFLNFSVYIASAIYTSSIPGLMVEYNVSLTTATLGLTLYVLAYGIGPMFLSPLQEVPALGRNPVYIAGLLVFVVCQIVIVTAKNMRTVLVMRFLTGFVGSPALATGGASMADVVHPQHLPYVIGLWSIGGVAGPIVGPVIGGFAAQAESWRWPMMEQLWIVSFALLFLGLFLPETYGPTILLRRAQRLRKLTGNLQLQTASERDGQSRNARDALYEQLVRPFMLFAEPALAFSNIYMGFVYAMFYLWFEAFPLVFSDIYHFNQGLSGLPFLGFIVSGGLAYAAYCLYQKYHLAPRFARAKAAKVELAPEVRLEIGLVGSFFIPASILIFGFTSKSSIPWIVPIVGAALYVPGIWIAFQSVAMYMTSAYPAYAASVLAGNTLSRATMASVFPLFGRAFFTNLGLGPASGLLAGISFLLIFVFWLLLKYGHILRQKSKYAHSA